MLGRMSGFGYAQKMREAAKRRAAEAKRAEKERRAAAAREAAYAARKAAEAKKAEQERRAAAARKAAYAAKKAAEVKKAEQERRAAAARKAAYAARKAAEAKRKILASNVNIGSNQITQTKKVQSPYAKTLENSWGSYLNKEKNLFNGSQADGKVGPSKIDKETTTPLSKMNKNGTMAAGLKSNAKAANDLLQRAFGKVLKSDEPSNASKNPAEEMLKKQEEAAKRNRRMQEYASQDKPEDKPTALERFLEGGGKNGSSFQGMESMNEAIGDFFEKLNSKTIDPSEIRTVPTYMGDNLKKGFDAVGDFFEELNDKTVDISEIRTVPTYMGDNLKKGFDAVGDHFKNLGNVETKPTKSINPEIMENLKYRPEYDSETIANELDYAYEMLNGDNSDWDIKKYKDVEALADAFAKHARDLKPNEGMIRMGLAEPLTPDEEKIYDEYKTLARLLSAKAGGSSGSLTGIADSIPGVGYLIDKGMDIDTEELSQTLGEDAPLVEYLNGYLDENNLDDFSYIDYTREEAPGSYYAGAFLGSLIPNPLSKVRNLKHLINKTPSFITPTLKEEIPDWALKELLWKLPNHVEMIQNGEFEYPNNLQALLHIADQLSEEEKDQIVSDFL